MFCFKWTGSCRNSHPHVPQDLFETQSLKSIIFSPSRPVNLPGISKEEFWMIRVLNVCFSHSCLLSVDCIFLSYADHLISYIALFWSYLSYRCLQFQVKFCLTFPLPAWLSPWWGLWIFFSQLISVVSCDITYLNCDRARRPRLPGARPPVPTLLAMA